MPGMKRNNSQPSTCKWAIITGRYQPVFNLEQDVAAIMGPSPLQQADPQLPDTELLSAVKVPRLYDHFIELYHAELDASTNTLVASYGPLLEQIFPESKQAV